MLKKIFIVVLILVAIFLATHLIRFKGPTIYGVTFNDEYAKYLGLDPHAVYQTILKDWDFKYIRLSAQWNNIAKAPGQYDFSQLDWQMDEAAAAGAKIVLAVGQKTPRWPECHAPQWASSYADDEYFSQLRDFIEMTVARYRSHPALEIWQVENEPFFSFGINCRPFTPVELSQEISLVRYLDADHKILVTDSGELSSWRATAQAGDLFGTTMYRVVWNKYLGYWNYDWLPALYYRAKLLMTGRSVDTAFIAELQAEPWIPDNNLFDTPISDQYKSMNTKRLQKNIDFAASTGMPRAYLWGAEWWYWLSSQGDNTISDFIKSVKKI